MRDSCMSTLMFLPGDGIKARMHVHVEITHSPTWCIIRTSRPVALCFPGPDDAPHWQRCDFDMDMGSCYNGPYAKTS